MITQARGSRLIGAEETRGLAAGIVRVSLPRRLGKLYGRRGLSVVWAIAGSKGRAQT